MHRISYFSRQFPPRIIWKSCCSLKTVCLHGEFPTEETIDADIVNQAKQTVTTVKCASIFSSAEPSHDSWWPCRFDRFGCVWSWREGNIARGWFQIKLIKRHGGASGFSGRRPDNIICHHGQHAVLKTGELSLLIRVQFALTGKGCI